MIATQYSEYAPRSQECIVAGTNSWQQGMRMGLLEILRGQEHLLLHRCHLSDRHRAGMPVAGMGGKEWMMRMTRIRSLSDSACEPVVAN